MTYRNKDVPVAPSGIVTLRTLAMKSIIGFGQFVDLTVQDAIALKRHRELLSIYYNLGNIDFNDEVKVLLKLKGERIIKKPGKDREAGALWIPVCMTNIIDEENLEAKGDKSQMYMRNAVTKVWPKKKIKGDSKHQDSINTSKWRNQSKVQGRYRR